MYPFDEYEQLVRSVGEGRYDLQKDSRYYLEVKDQQLGRQFGGLGAALLLNWMRVQQLIAIPNRMLYVGTWHQQKLDEAALEILGDGTTYDSEAARDQAIWDKYESLPDPTCIVFGERAGIGYFTKRDEFLAAMLSAQVSAIVVNAWTALEVATFDTWTLLVNERPNKLGERLLKAKTADDEGKRQDQERQLSFELLRQHGFDVRKKMGLLLRDKFKLRTLPQIIVAYQEALGKEHPICKSLTTQDLRALHAVRNAIVHLGEMVDKKFVKDTGSHPKFNHYKDGERLRLTAEQVLPLIDAAFSASKEVVYGTLKWLEAHPD